MANKDRRTGGCLCGKLRYEVTLEEPTYNICHCSMCRKWSAGPYMAVHCKGDDVVFANDETLSWYRGSQWAERGFCTACGSSLFYRLANQPEMMFVVSIDSLDDPSGITLESHIYSDAAPDRYAFADDCRRVTEAELLAELGITTED